MAYQSNNSGHDGGENEIVEDDIYKRTFKQYKFYDNKSTTNPSLSSPIVDLSNCDTILPENVILQEKSGKNLPIPECPTSDHFKPFDQWRCFTLKDTVPGLMIIPGILRESYRSDWFSYFHDDLPWRDDLNLKANVALEKNGTKLPENLRWITFGYHHDWNSKVYSLDQPEVIIPDRIKDLSLVASTFLGIENFKAEAGIVNYYNRKSSLCFHTDHSEMDYSIPLFSFSLGSPAIFLIGGLSKDSPTPIVPIMLRDSDLLIMSDESRLALHAVAKIVVPNDRDDEGQPPKNKKRKSNGSNENDKSKIYRINVNVRQVNS